MAGDLLNISLSGIQANRLNLSVTGQNISNANVEGYSRQEANLSTRPAQRDGSFFVGSGVTIDQVRRVADQFLTRQIMLDSSQKQQTQAMQSGLDALDKMLSSENSGLTTDLNRFFLSFQAVAQSPSSVTAREVLLGDARGLANRFQTLGGDLGQRIKDVNQQLDTLSGQINELSSAIARLNINIAVLSGNGSGTQPNDMLDQRDQLLRKLSELVQINTISQSDGSINVMLDKGSALVVGGQASSVSSGPDPNDNARSLLYLQLGTQRQSLSSGSLGGQLGGLLDYRDQALAPTLTELGRIGGSIALLVNQQHQLGVDLEGRMGGLFFADPNSATLVAQRVQPNLNNPPPKDQVMAVQLLDPAQFKSSDYKLDLIGPANDQYTLTRLSDNVQISSGNFGALPANISVDGVQIDLTSGTFRAGDHYLITPFRAVPNSMAMAVSRPQSLALAQPVRGSATLTNQGSGALTTVEMTDRGPYDASTLALPLRITFTSGTAYTVTDGNSATVAAGLPYPPTGASGMIPAALGLKVTMSGSPVAGDSFTVQFNSQAVGDNRNALALGALGNRPLLEQGTLALIESDRVMTGRVGTLAARAKVAFDSADASLRQSQAQRDAMSGVNLDEEAAKMIEFQNSYNASARLIQVASELFDTLLNSVGR